MPVVLLQLALKLYPPAFRSRAADSLDAYFGSVAKLRKAADEKRDALPATDNGDGDW